MGRHGTSEPSPGMISSAWHGPVTSWWQSTKCTRKHVWHQRATPCASDRIKWGSALPQNGQWVMMVDKIPSAPAEGKLSNICKRIATLNNNILMQ